MCREPTDKRGVVLTNMDPAAIQHHLTQAERHAAEGRQLVARQEALIAELDRDGHDATGARKVLEILQDTQMLHEADVQRLIEELQAASQPLG